MLTKLDWGWDENYCLVIYSGLTVLRPDCHLLSVVPRAWVLEIAFTIRARRVFGHKKLLLQLSVLAQGCIRRLSQVDIRSGALLIYERWRRMIFAVLDSPPWVSWFWWGDFRWCHRLISTWSLSMMTVTIVFSETILVFHIHHFEVLMKWVCAKHRCIWPRLISLGGSVSSSRPMYRRGQLGGKVPGHHIHVCALSRLVIGQSIRHLALCTTILRML